MLTTLTRETFEKELSQLQAQIKSYEDKLTLWKMQERLGNIFLQLTEEPPSQIYVVNGVMKQRIEASPAYFSLHSAGTVDVTIYRGTSSPETHYWTNHPEFGLSQDELKTLTMQSDWTKDNLNVDVTTLTMDRFEVKATWSFVEILEIKEEITVSLEENQPTIRLPPAFSQGSQGSTSPLNTPGVPQPQGMPTRSLNSMTNITGMAKALLTPNSSTAGMGLAERTAVLESPEEEPPSLDTKSPELLLLLSRVHGRAMAKATPTLNQ